MSNKRDTRRALTRLFADRDAAVTAYALAFLDREKLRRRLAGMDGELRDLKRKAREAGARAGDLEAAERAMIQDLDDDTASDGGHAGDAPEAASTASDDSVSASPTPDPVPGDPVGDGAYVQTDGSPVTPDGGGF